MNHNAGVLAVALLLGAAAPVHADQIVAKSGGGPKSDGIGRHAVAAGGPTGMFVRRATANDSAATPTTVSSPSPNAGTYPVPIVAGSSTTGAISNPGLIWNPSATGCLSYGPGFWDSSCSSATVTRIALGIGETAEAHAVAIDPASYEIIFDLDFPPEIIFQLTFATGMNLAALSGADFTASASIQGTYETDLLAGPLWSFSWSANSSNTDGSSFVFTSDPLLGLDDAAIAGAFLAGVTSSGGVHTLERDIVVTASIFPSLAPGVDRVEYQYGGEVTHTAEAVSVPEPPMEALLAFSILAAVASVRRSRRRPRAERPAPLR